MARKHLTFFGKTFGWLWDQIKTAFTAGDGHFLEVAINFTNRVKDALNSKAVDFITSLIPGDLDDKIVEILKAQVPIILADELMVQAAGAPATEEEGQALAAKLVDSFGGLSDINKEKFYTSIAAKIYIFLHDHAHGEKVTFGQAARFVETAYEAWLASKGDTTP